MERAQLPSLSARGQRSKVLAAAKVKFMSQSWHFSKPANKYRHSVLRLPPEIRNRIMEFVLVPGDIYLPKQHNKTIIKARRLLRVKGPIEAVAKRIQYPNLAGILATRQAQQHPDAKYGVQVLATCKQLYCEGYAIFYSLNTFHLASGLPENSTDYFDGLQPHHRALIKHVAVDISLADISPAVLTILRSNILREGFDSGFSGLAFTAACICFGKLNWLRDWDSFSEVRIQYHSPHHPHASDEKLDQQAIVSELVMEQDDLPNVVPLPAFSRDHQIHHLLAKAVEEMCDYIRDRVVAKGWEEFAQWLDLFELRPAECLETIIWKSVCLYPPKFLAIANGD